MKVEIINILKKNITNRKQTLNFNNDLYNNKYCGLYKSNEIFKKSFLNDSYEFNDNKIKITDGYVINYNIIKSNIRILSINSNNEYKDIFQQRVRKNFDFYKDNIIEEKNINKEKRRKNCILIILSNYRKSIFQNQRLIWFNLNRNFDNHIMQIYWFLEYM